jgi:hypothetical protein
MEHDLIEALAVQLSPPAANSVPSLKDAELIDLSDGIESSIAAALACPISTVPKSPLATDPKQDAQSGKSANAKIDWTRREPANWLEGG